MTEKGKYDTQGLVLHSKQYRFFKMNTSVFLPCNPWVIVLQGSQYYYHATMGLHDNSTEGFLKNPYRLECNIPADTVILLTTATTTTNATKATNIDHIISPLTHPQIPIRSTST